MQVEIPLRNYTRALEAMASIPSLQWKENG